MQNEIIREAAKTLITMCADYLTYGIDDSTFVSNLDVYAECCNGELIKSAEAVEGQG